MLATNLFSERTDPAAKMAPIDTVPTDRMMAHAATDSMDLKGTVVHIPATSSPDESEEVTPTHDVMPLHTSEPQPSEAKQAVPAITLEGATEVKPVDAHAHAQPQVGSLAVPEQSEDRTFQQQIQNAFTPAVKPVTAAPAPTTLPEPSNVQSIITPLTSTASATSGLSYLTSFPSMVKLDTQLLMRELRLLGSQRPASQTDRVPASTTTTEHDRKDRSRTLRSMLPISARKSTDAGAGRRSEEEKIGSKKRPHPLKRRSSSIKRMSSVFGDWQVTNVRAANSNVAAENRGGADEAAGMSCELPVAAGTMQSPSLGGLDTVLEMDPPPSQQELAELYEMEVLDTMRDKHKFGTLIKDANYERVVIVFIRHFFCGVCEFLFLFSPFPLSTFSYSAVQRSIVLIGVLTTRVELLRIRPRVDQRNARLYARDLHAKDKVDRHRLRGSRAGAELHQDDRLRV